MRGESRKNEITFIDFKLFKLIIVFEEIDLDVLSDCFGFGRHGKTWIICGYFKDLNAYINLMNSREK